MNATDRVEGRECGACTVCCTVLPIDTRELRKLPGVSCKHLKAQGCGVYDTRFPICRSYYCGWHKLDWLNDDWRPDISGVLISPHNDDLPPGYTQGGIEFLVFGGEAALRAKEFVPALATCIARGFATFLAVPGPVGHFSARVFLNEILAGPVARKDSAAILQILVRMVASAASHRFEKMS